MNPCTNLSPECLQTWRKRTGNLLCVSYVSGSDPAYWPSLTALGGSWHWEQRRGVRLLRSTWDKGILTGVFTARPNAHPYAAFWACVPDCWAFIKETFCFLCGTQRGRVCWKKRLWHLLPPPWGAARLLERLLCQFRRKLNLCLSSLMRWLAWFIFLAKFCLIFDLCVGSPSVPSH